MNLSPVKQQRLSETQQTVIRIKKYQMLFLDSVSCDYHFWHL